MRTMQEGCATVEIVAWPEDRPWEGRYQTSSSIERGICRLLLSPAVFHDTSKANTAYRRFAGKIERAGLVPPRVEFRSFVSRASERLFCVLTKEEAVFNSGCRVGRMSILETGEGTCHRVLALLVDEARTGEAKEAAVGIKTAELPELPEMSEMSEMPFCEGAAAEVA